MTSRFAVAVHVLTLLAMARDDESLCSEYLASSVNTNPVVIRRLLGILRKAQLVEVQPGAHGGARLAKPARRITLSEVHAAFDERAFAPHAAPPNADCPAGRVLPGILDDIFFDAEHALRKHLARTTIADVTKRVAEKANRASGAHQALSDGTVTW